MLRIGTFASLAGTSAKALRDYDALGLFRPAWIDPATGYRAYSPAQLPELRRILALRGMGVGLAEIGRLVAGGAGLAAVLDRRRAELELERREIDRRLAALDIHLGTGGSGDDLDVVVRPVAAEPVATLALAAGGGGDVEAAFYELEVHVRDHGRRARRPPGTLIHAEAAGGGGREVEVFVPVRGPLVATDRVGYRRLPAARMATMIHRGPYGSLPATRAALERWACAAGMAADRTAPHHLPQFGARAGAGTAARLPGGPGP